jgi:peptide/nickel transport system substrate-binding protein
MLFAVLLISLPLAGAQEKTLTIALGSEPDDLNPVGNDIAYDLIKIYSGLVKSDDDLQMVPDLAESWEMSPDGKTYTFHLKKGVKWQDGTDFTADDVLFTYDLMRSGDWVSIFSISSDYDLIQEVSVVDPSTVKFTLKEGIVSFIDSFALPILPKHILEGQDLAKTDYWQDPIGTGPYKFESWNKGEELVLKANTDYYGKAPNFDTIRYVFVPDENSRINLLTSGEVDAIKIDPRSTNSLEGKSGIKVYSTPSANWYSINLPNNITPFDSKEVRKAIAYAINKQEIVDTVFNGQGEVAYVPFRKADWVYNPDVAFNYDPEKAEQLLKDAGFVKGSDGIFERDKKKLEFDLIYLTSSLERKDVAIAVSTDLAKIGIKANLVGKSGDEVTMADWHNVIVRAGGNPLDPDVYNYKEFDSKFIGQGYWNLASYSNPEVDKLLEEGRTTFDKDERKKIYQQFQSIIADDQPTVFIAFSNNVYAINDKITGIKPRNGPHGGSGNTGSIIGNIWWNAEEWTIQ